MDSKKQINVFFAQVPDNWTTKIVLICLKTDPYQTRFSSRTIPLMSKTSQVQKPLSEFVNDVIGDSRFAIETKTDFVFISRVKNSVLGDVFFVSKVLSKEELRKQERKDDIKLVY